MSDVDIPYNQQSYGTNNQQFQTNDIVRLRLDLRDLLKQVELHLANKEIVVEEGGGVIVEKEVSRGAPLMNARGIRTLMGQLTMILGPHTVQGNLERDQFENILEETSIFIARNIVVERVNWEINVDDLAGIIDYITMAVYIFLTRTIDDGERKSYANTMRSVQTNTEAKRPGMLRGLFGG